MRKNKLYTVNPWNKNLFFGGGPKSSVIIGGTNPNSYYDSYYGKAKPTTTTNTDTTATIQQPTVMQQIAQNKSNGNTNVGVAAGGTSFTQTPVYIQQTAQGVTDNNPNGVLKIDTSGIPKNMDTKLGDKVGWQQNGYLATAMNIAGQVKVNDKDRRGLFDTLDPFHNIAGKKADSTAVGKTLGDIGAAAASTGIPYAMLAGAALKVIGDIADNGWGYSIENEEAVKNNIAGLRNVNFNAADFDTLQDQFNQAGIRKVGLGEVDNGLFTDRGTEKAEELNRQQNEAYEYALSSFRNAGRNIDRDLYEDYMRNYAAYGGPLDSSNFGGALGIMQQNQYIDAINNRSNAIAKANTMQAPTFSFNKFDDGGFVDGFMQDPIAAAMNYIRQKDAEEAQAEAQAAQEAEKQAYADMQTRLMNAETQNQGLQALLEDQGRSIASLQEAQALQASATPQTTNWQEPMIEAAREVVRNNGGAGSLRDYIKKSEKFSPTAYQLEGEAHPTIGYGFYNVYPGTNRKVKKGDVLSQAEADRYLDVAIQERADNLAKKVPNWNKLTSNQQDALIDLAFNAGDNARHFRKGSKLMTALANEDWDAASEQLATTSRNPNFKRGMQNRSNRRRNMFVNGDYSIKAFGGELGTNGTDFTNGLLQVNAGNTHERNPFGGVPLGVDSQGVPNLVEEGETVFNDYVFSKRLKVPNFMLKDLGLGGAMQKGKRHRMSFADVSKKLAEESEMRPNDPISMNGLNASLSKLMEIQEAERMKQQAKMQNEEMEMMPEMGLMAACGGKLNRYDYGGALNWLRQNHPELEHKEQLAKYLSKLVDSDRQRYYGRSDTSMFGNNDSSRGVEPRYDWAWRALSPVGNINTQAHIRKWMDLGATKDEAFNAVFPKKEDRDRLWVRNMYDSMGDSRTQPRTSATSNSTTWGTSAAGLHTRTIGGKTQYRGADGKYYNSEQQALKTRNTQAPKAKSATPAANNQASRAQAAPTSSSTPSKAASNTGSTRSAARRNAAPATNRAAQNTTQGRNRGDIVNYKYDWYRNGDDGTGTHWGFTPDENGIIDTTTGYTDDYRNLVSTLTADDIRKWAAEHPNDPSLQSFIANNGADALTNLTDDQWRRGATDGRYGFMHHVAAQIGADNLDLPIEENGARPLAEVGYGLTEDELNAPGRRIDTQNGAWTGSGNPVADAANAAAGQRTDVQGPPTYKTWMRYAPAVGAGLFALTDALGITNKPDYTYADKLEAASNRAGYAPNIQAPYIGDYMRYTPFDRLFYSNQLQANARATDRALMNNSGANRGTASANLLANAYNTNNNLGNLYRQGDEYNRAQYERTKEFNRRTNMFNAQMGLEADMANARYRQQASQMGLSGLAQAANMRENIDARTGATRSANLSNLFTSLGNIGRENMAFNMINSTNAARNGYWIDNKGVVHYVGRGDGLV